MMSAAPHTSDTSHPANLPEVWIDDINGRLYAWRSLRCYEPAPLRKRPRARFISSAGWLYLGTAAAFFALGILLGLHP